jgi:cation transport regulator ChaB
MITRLPQQYQTAEITGVKGYDGMPGNERADALAEKAAEKVAWSATTSLSNLRRESRLLRFLELSSVGRSVEGGV